ncbi:MAG: hypothetical protein ACXACC_09205 [Promethearchaeota archaeon]|jgi:hypothetical protein
MKNIKIIVVIVSAAILFSGFTVIAKPETAPGQLKEKNPNAPGQWKKTTQYANQGEFVLAIHMRIWNRLQARNVSPPGLMKLIGLLSQIIGDETEEEEFEEEPEEELEEESEEEPEEELEEEYEEESEEEPEEELEEEYEEESEEEPEEEILV